MEIKKGDRFRCVKDLGEFYTYGMIYESKQDKCITDNHKNEGHFWINLTDLDGNICFERVTEGSDKINPSHYKAYDIESIEMMIRIWGKEEAAIFCKLNAFKYRLRMGMKDDIQIEIEKESKYLAKWKELRDGE